jgi:hypothetical protein
MREIWIQVLVRRILASEAGDSQDPEHLLDAADRVFDKLRAHLSKRIGQEGYRTLLARAVVLSLPAFPKLCDLRLETNGVLAGLRPAAETGSREKSGAEPLPAPVDGATAVASCLLDLLAAFIGEDLTLHMLRAIWPEVPLDDATDRKDERI